MGKKHDIEQLPNIWALMRAWGVAVAAGRNSDRQMSMLRGVAARDPDTLRYAIQLGCSMHDARMEYTHLPDTDIRHPLWQRTFLEALKDELGL